ncbi:hypothetical protein KY362_07110 [Candidatus Woesearchaeota archaeon]|nr:hypothetical protein [Candidatus Woesearchaeota archaeon]
MKDDTRRMIPTFLVILLLVLLLLVLRVEALIQTDIVYSMDDTYVNSSSSGTNYDGSRLRVQGSNVETWFRFNLSDPAGYYVTQSLLYLYVAALSSSSSFDIEDGDDASWTETDLTWATKPGTNSVVDSTTVSSTGFSIWDLTSHYAGQFGAGTAFVAYALTGSQNLTLEDKENSGDTGNVPYLNLTMMIPEVYLLSPADPYSTYDTTITFQYNTTDTGAITNCSILFDGAVNKTNTTVGGNLTSTFEVSGIVPGDHTWAIRCYDSGRQVYEINPGTRDLTVQAKADWYNPSSATPLDIGAASLNAAAPEGTREIYSNNSNTNVAVTCASGDCAVISTNWTTVSMTGGQVIGAMFNCTTTTAGSYQADFELTSDEDASADTLTVNCSILAPDLRISSENITFSDSSPVEGTSVTITAGIYNDGTYDATNAVVRFYEGHYSTGVQIGSDHTINLSAGASTTLQETWTSKIGQTDIYVVVDPDVDVGGVIEESDESDNYNYSTVDTAMWTIFTGNVTGQLVLDTSENFTVMKWNVTDTTDSIIYVTDTDSIPSFDSLFALSRNTLGTYMSNDFTELDSLLNTTGFDDSINLSYTRAGSPIETQDFAIFGNTVSNVPVVNSTNSSTFVTGILWDSSDDESDNQFDDTAKEDVIFISRVNVSQQGLYGVYDYEIRVPSRLKRYKGADFNTVTFYTEIK